jgi:sugar lactone lactonase YvrE
MAEASQPDIVADVHATLAEGPVWDERRQSLLWVDILPGRIHRLNPATGGDEVFVAGKPVGSIALRRDGGLVVAIEDGFALFNEKRRRLEQVAVIDHPGPRARFNDGKCDPSGRFLAGTMAYDQSPGTGRLYRLDPDRSVKMVLGGVTISNGLAWTSDGTTMYYVDSPTHGIDAFDYDPANGTLANRRRVVSIPSAAGMPDGMAIDADGCLWVALYGGAAVHRYTPDGRLDTTISFPVTNVTCPAFGGPELAALYVTSARVGLDDNQLAEQPHAGAIFAVDVTTCGLPAHTFAG